MLVEVHNEVSFTLEFSGEVIGMHVGKGAFFILVCVCVDHFKIVPIFVIIIGRYLGLISRVSSNCGTVRKTQFP